MLDALRPLTRDLVKRFKVLHVQRRQTNCVSVPQMRSFAKHMLRSSSQCLDAVAFRQTLTASEKHTGRS